MRTLLVFLLILAIGAGAIALYLFATTPKESAGVTFPLTPEQRSLLARVPAGADAFALIPSAGLLSTKLEANPVTRGPFERWTETQQIPGPWMLGGADVVAWRDGKRTSYAIRLDTVRAFLVRIWMMWSNDVDAQWDGTAFVINGAGGARIQQNAIDAITELAAGLPPGDLFAVQLNRDRGAFPPIGRPAVTSVKITAAEIVTVSRAKGESLGQAPVNARFPTGAMFAVTFAEPPRILGDVGRILGTNLTTLVSGGGAIALYDIDTGTFLPRPKGVIAVPSTPERRAAMEDVIRAAELVGDHRDTGQELLVAFDRTSLPLYLKDASIPASWPVTGWAVRLDPAKLVPVLEKLGDSTALRIASPRLHRGARDLRRWISALENAQSVEAGTSSADGTEELRVRIASK
jgi:hypothetical protein